MAWLAVGMGVAVAHDSPEHVVEMLTARMDVVGPRADLLWRRAAEYRSLSRLREAERDLRAALRVQPAYAEASIDLARVQLQQGSPRTALRTVRRALEQAGQGGGPVRADLAMMHAEVLGAAGRVSEAVTACDQALNTPGTATPDWYLARCQFQYRLGRFRDAAAGLREGFERTGNAVLEAEWIDARLDAGEYDEALPQVEPQLEQSRLQAAWRIRRGRALLGLGRIAEAQADFLAAITELNGRLGGRRLDFTVLAERGLAYALLGDFQPARADLLKARELGADDWAVGRLERTLAAGEAEAKPGRERKSEPSPARPALRPRESQTRN